MNGLRLQILGRGEKGSAVVEFAFVLPILLALALLLIEGGNIFNSWLTLQKSAQMAVRFATTGQGDEEGNRLALILAEARKLESSLPGTSPTMQVDVCSRPGTDLSASCSSGNPGNPCEMVEVRTSAIYTPMTPFLEAMLPANLEIAGRERGINEPWRACQ